MGTKLKKGMVEMLEFLKEELEKYEGLYNTCKRFPRLHWRMVEIGNYIEKLKKEIEELERGNG